MFKELFGGSDVKIGKFLSADKIWVRAGVGGHGAGWDWGWLSKEFESGLARCLLLGDGVGA